MLTDQRKLDRVRAILRVVLVTLDAGVVTIVGHVPWLTSVRPRPQASREEFRVLTLFTRIETMAVGFNRSVVSACRRSAPGIRCPRPAGKVRHGEPRAVGRGGSGTRRVPARVNRGCGRRVGR